MVAWGASWPRHVTAMRLALTGWTERDIATALGVAEATVARYLPDNPHRAYRPDAIRATVEQYGTGATGATIAVAVSRNVSTVLIHIRWVGYAYESGRTLETIAAELGTDPTQVTRVLARAGHFQAR